MYSLYILCMYKKTYKISICTKNIHFKFQALFSLHFAQVLYSLHIFCMLASYLGIWLFDVPTYFVHSISYKILICTIFLYNIYIYTKLVFCMVFLYILYSVCTCFLVRTWASGSLGASSAQPTQTLVSKVLLQLGSRGGQSTVEHLR